MSIVLTGASTSIGKCLLHSLKNVPLRVIGNLNEASLMDKSVSHSATHYRFTDLSIEKETFHALQDCKTLILANAEYSGKSRLVKGSALTDIAVQQNEMRLIKSAKSNGIEHLIRIASCNDNMISEQSPVEVGRNQWKIEEMIRQSGIPYTFIHPNRLMQSLLEGVLYDMICSRKISLPYGKSSVAWVDGYDVAHVIFKIMDSPAENKTLILTGLESLHWESVAHELSRNINETVVYSSLPLYVSQLSMWMKGFNGDDITNHIQMSKFFLNHDDTVTNVIQEITSQKPMPLSNFIRQHKKDWPYSGFK